MPNEDHKTRRLPYGILPGRDWDSGYESSMSVPSSRLGMDGWMDEMRNRNSVVVIGMIVLSGLAVYTVCRKASTTTSTGTGNTPSTPKPPVLDEKTKTAIAELTARWDELQAFSATVSTELPQAAGNPGTTQGKGTYEWSKRGEKRLIRFFLVNTIRITTGEAKTLRTAEILNFVYDGEFLYSQLQQPTTFKQTTKSRYEPDRVLQIGGKDLFRGLSESNSLKLQPEEMLNGRASYVIEATPTTGKSSSIHYFDKQTGVRSRLIERDETGKATLTLTLSELNTSPEFSEDYFMYKLPEGFELIDKTKVEP
jgi:outer membrane lipoprotein-sorting protein